MDIVPMEELTGRLSDRWVPADTQIEVTRRCNLRCRHCFRDVPAESELSGKRIRRLMDEIADMGGLSMGFTGGEPLCREDLLDLMAYARSKNFSVSIITNGTLLTDEIADRLKDLHSPVRFSLYGSRPEVHERVTQVPGSFEQTIRAMKTVVRHGIRASIMCVMMKLNYEDLENVKALCERMGVEFNAGIPIFPRDSGATDTLSFRLSDEEMRRAKKLFDLSLDQGEELAIGYCRLCGAGRTTVYITAEGRLVPCGMARLDCGDLTEESFEAIWRGSPELARVRAMSNRDFPQCLACENSMSCPLCLAMGYTERGELSPIAAEACRIARIFGEERSRRHVRKAG